MWSRNGVTFLDVTEPARASSGVQTSFAPNLAQWRRARKKGRPAPALCALTVLGANVGEELSYRPVPGGDGFGDRAAIEPVESPGRNGTILLSKHAKFSNSTPMSA